MQDRPDLLRRALAGALLAAPALGALAQAYPSRPVKLVVPFAAGSGTDTVARMLSEELQGELGQPVVVENRPGANGTIASDFVAKSAADGYTLLMGGSSTHSSAPSLFKSLPYDPERDFEMLANIVESQFLVVVRAESAAQSVHDLQNVLQAKGGKGSWGYGSATTQIAGSSLVKRLAVTATPVPYKSNPPAITDLIGGQTDFIFLDQTTALPQIKGGRVRALAVAAGQRMAELPQVPTFAEAGVPNFQLQSWLGVLAPRGIAPAIADQLSATLGRIMNKPTVRERLAPAGRPIPPAPRTGFPAYLRAQREAWAGKIREAGIQPE
jgi:tripartite-type tricarboxylate transporter receptor subunit TctC